MRTLATSLLALAACHSDGSLEVWVEPRPEMPLSEIELYVGILEPHKGESIKPRSGELAETVWWKRDHNRGEDILQWDAEAIERGAVRYQLLADELDEVRALVAVGYAVEGDVRKVVGVATYMHDFAIGSGEIHRRYMTLGDFDELPRRELQEPRMNVPGILIWGPPEDPRACVQVDNAPELVLPGAAQSAMIVTHGDPDCDSFTRTEDPDKNECRPAEYNSVEPRARESLSCLIPDTVPPSPGGNQTVPIPVCLAGGPTCKDGPGDVACAPSSWCAPTRLCGDTTTPPCDDFTCEGISVGVPTISCDLTYDPQTLRWCTGTNATLKLSTYVPGVACDPTRVTMLRKPSTSMWLETLVYGSGDEMWLTVVPKVQDVCEFELRASGPLQDNLLGGMVLNYPAAIAFPLTKPMFDRGLGLPIRFHAEQSAGCAEVDSTCVVSSWTTDPGIAACIGAAVNDPAHYIP